METRSADPITVVPIDPMTLHEAMPMAPVGQDSENAQRSDIDTVAVAPDNQAAIDLELGP